jgi:putative nucleotidyltransferase with HDIG domain
MCAIYEPINLDDIIESANSLEPLPASATRLSSILAQADWQLEDVVEVVSLDQGLTGKLLSLANSAAQAAQDRVATVDQAVVRLGAGSVLSVAIGSGVRKQVDTTVPEYGLAEGELWAISVAASVVADGLRAYTQRRIPLEASTAALLHDVGKLVLGRYLNDDLLRYLAAARDISGHSEEKAEIEVLGVNHAELGALIAQSWNLPPIIVEGISYHHAPGDAYFAHTESTIAHAVHLSSIVAEYVVSDTAPLPENTPMLAASKIRLGISMGDFELLCQDMRVKFRAVQALYE